MMLLPLVDHAIVHGLEQSRADGTLRIDAGQFGVARAGIRHRGRVEGRATLLVIDGFACK